MLCTCFVNTVAAVFNELIEGSTVRVRSPEIYLAHCFYSPRKSNSLNDALATAATSSWGWLGKKRTLLTASPVHNLEVASLPASTS